MGAPVFKIGGRSRAAGAGGFDSHPLPSLAAPCGAVSFLLKILSQISLSSIPPSSSRRCRATTAEGRPCRAWAIQDTPYCALHSDHDQANPLPGDPDPGPPRRRLETIDDVIADMFEKMARFSAMIDQVEDMDSYMKMLAVYSRNATHLTRIRKLARTTPALQVNIATHGGQQVNLLDADHG